MPLSHWPPVSVVMPVLNEERHLEEAVGRVLDQDYPGELEVVLAIGPSKDRTQEIADKLADRDPRISIVPNPTGKTPAARNGGVGHATRAVGGYFRGWGGLGPGAYARCQRPRPNPLASFTSAWPVSITALMRFGSVACPAPRLPVASANLSGWMRS